MSAIKTANVDKKLTEAFRLYGFSEKEYSKSHNHIRSHPIGGLIFHRLKTHDIHFS